MSDHPEYQPLMLPLLRLAAEGQTRVSEAAGRIADAPGLSAEECARMLPSGRQSVLHNRLHWAKFYMSKAGLIDQPSRGRFVASDAGRVLLAENPDRITLERLLRFPAFRLFYKGAGTPSANASTPPSSAAPPAPETTPEEQIDAAVTLMGTALRVDILARIADNSPGFFEGLIVDLLVAMGYGGNRRGAARRLGGSGDGDGVIDEDRFGLDRDYVQAKRYAASTTVGRPEVRGFVGSLVGLGAQKGVFVTTSSFSAGAIDFVRHLTQRVILIDGQRLADLMIEHHVGVRVSRTIAFKRLDEAFFGEEF